MLALGFADWVFWESYAPPNSLVAQKVTFDGPNLRIIVNDGVTDLNFGEDVYSAWEEWINDPNHSNDLYPQALSVVGGDPLPGNRRLGTTYFLENGWKMRTWEGDHELTVSGNFFTRTGESSFVNTLLPWTIIINLNTSTLVETIIQEIPATSIPQEDIDRITQQTVQEVWAYETNSVSITADGTNITADSGVATVDGSNISTTILEKILNIPDDVWDEIIDNAKSQTAREKLRAIATKTQDIALS